MQGNWKLAEEIGLEITQVVKRQNCWKQIGKNIYNQLGYFKAMDRIIELNTPEAKTHFKLGVIEQINTSTIGKEICLHFLKDMENQISSIEHVLQIYALNQLFFEELGQDKVQRYNHSLNIQWAIDNKNKLN
jgi:hypothetical protein